MSRNVCHKILRAFCVLTAFCLLCISMAMSPPMRFVSAASSSTRGAKVVRVGYYEDGDYMHKNDDGGYEGFNFEYLQEIQKYTGWIFEVVDGISWDHTLEMLENGKIDLLPAVYSTKEREGKFLFSSMPMCNIYTTLNVRVDDDRFAYENFAALSGMKVGIIEGSKDGDSFRQYCTSNSIDCTIVPYAETAKLLSALSDGTLDGVAITHLGRNSTFRSIAQFSPEPIYFAFAKGRTDLRSALDRAVTTIKLRDPYYESEMYEKYFSISAAQKPVFTKEEQAYIASTGTIRAAYDTSLAPVSYQDVKTGEFKGLAADLFKSITEYSGLQFAFVPVPSDTTTLEMLRQGDVDVGCAVASNYLWDQKNHIHSTKNYLTAPIVRISAMSSPVTKGERVAMKRGFLITKKIEESNSDQTMIYYDTIEECFEALRKGEADVTFANHYLVDNLLQNPLYDRFAVTTLSNYSDEVSVGVSSECDPLLFSIIDKCVQYTAAETIDEMLLRNAMASRPNSIRVFFAQRPALLIGVVSAFFTLIVLVLAAILWMKSRGNRRIRRLLYRDSLTGLATLTRFRLDAGRLLGIGEDNKTSRGRTSRKKRSYKAQNSDTKNVATNYPSQEGQTQPIEPLDDNHHEKSLHTVPYKNINENIANGIHTDRSNRHTNKPAYAVLYTDIKQFKTINDAFGFGEGDELLQLFAHVLRDETGEDELCARASADQFVVLYHYESWESLCARTDKIHRTLEARLKAAGKTYRLVLIFGVYLPRGDEEDVSFLLDFANYARRSAKFTHKTATVRYDEAMRQEELLHRGLADRMDDALHNGEFVPYFQPKVNMLTGRIIGCEALVRWEPPGTDPILPGRFIPFFEHNGFVLELDLYIYEAVCRALRHWADVGHKLLPVSCNFSRLHFMDADFPNNLAAIADRYLIPHQILRLEITEGVMIEDFEPVRKQFDALRALGFPVVIDDFGLGYSSLSLLQQLSVDAVKLDRSFIAGGLERIQERKVVYGVVRLVESLGIQIVCEGVETKAQVERLTALGCRTAQGFYYYRPMPQKDFEACLLSNIQEFGEATIDEIPVGTHIDVAESDSH